MKALDRPDTPVLMTTAHEDESLREVLEFATTAAIPDERYAANCQHVVLVFHGNVQRYNEARDLLEDMLEEWQDEAS
ncbi:MAG TPA: hypothetical protein VEK57_17630 [Thermoanaerobaculia bacterium]|nr:hypothetical protein [Thermoanaerobaculia bacterium]